MGAYTTITIGGEATREVVTHLVEAVAEDGGFLYIVNGGPGGETVEIGPYDFYIVRKPFIGIDRLSPEERIAKVAALADRIAAIVASGDKPLVFVNEEARNGEMEHCAAVCREHKLVHRTEWAAGDNSGGEFDPGWRHVGADGAVHGGEEGDGDVYTDEDGDPIVTLADLRRHREAWYTLHEVIAHYEARGAQPDIPPFVVRDAG